MRDDGSRVDSRSPRCPGGCLGGCGLSGHASLAACGTRRDGGGGYVAVQRPRRPARRWHPRGMWSWCRWTAPARRGEAAGVRRRQAVRRRAGASGAAVCPGRVRDRRAACRGTTAAVRRLRGGRTYDIGSGSPSDSGSASGSSGTGARAAVAPVAAADIPRLREAGPAALNVGDPERGGRRQAVVREGHRLVSATPGAPRCVRAR